MTAVTIDEWRGTKRFISVVKTEKDSNTQLLRSNAATGTPDVTTLAPRRASNDTDAATRLLREEDVRAAGEQPFSHAIARIHALSSASGTAAMFVLNGLKNASSTYQRLGLPSLAAAIEPDEGTISLEWILPDRRLGFFCDPEPNDSSWFLVRRFGAISSSGPLRDADIARLAQAFIRDEDA